MPRWSLTKALLALTAFQLLASVRCKSVAVPHRLQFSQQVELHPYQKVYHIGDTMTLEFTDTAGMAFDTISHALARVDSFTYTLSAGIGRMDNVGKPIPPGGYFLVSNDNSAFSPVLGDISYGVTNVRTKLGCGGGPDLHYIVKFIPKQAGIYLLDPILYNYNSLYYCSSGAPAGAGMDFFFNLADCNADLLAGTDIVPKEMPTYTAIALGKKAFIFKVE